MTTPSPAELDVARPVRIDAWRTSDGRVFEVRAMAAHHQRHVNQTEHANRLLSAGASVGRAALESGLIPSDCYPELFDLYTSTKLIVSHYQCRDQPGYQPVRFEIGGGVLIHGDAGSWSGPYGNVESLTEVARLWTATKERTRPGGEP